MIEGWSSENEGEQSSYDYEEEYEEVSTLEDDLDGSISSNVGDDTESNDIHLEAEYDDESEKDSSKLEESPTLFIFRGKGHEDQESPIPKFHQSRCRLYTYQSVLTAPTNAQ